MKHKNDCVFNAKLYGKQRFGFRKLSVGLVAAALGTTFFLSEGQLVHADEQQPTQTESSNPSQSDLSKKVETNTVSGQGTQHSVSDRNESDNDIDAKTGNEDQDRSVPKIKAQTVSSPNSSKLDNVITEKVESSSDKNKDQVSDEKNVTQLTVAGNAADNNDKQPASTLDENTKVETKATDEKGNETTTVDTNKTKQMMAGQDTVNVHIDLDNLKPTDKQISFHFSDVGNADKLVIAGSNDHQTNDDWDVSNDGKGTITAKWINDELDPDKFSLIVPLQGNRNTVTKTTDPFKVTVDIKKSSDNADKTYDVLNVQLTPYKDHVKEDEIVKGFGMGQKTVADEKANKHISDEDIKNTGAADNQTVLQWGVYFNYGKNGNINPDLKSLRDAIFNIDFGGDQKLLPSSILVYQVPDNMIVDDNGDRMGIDDKLPDGSTYYQSITKDDNSRPDFVKYLQDHVNGNRININQKGIFTINNDPDYSKHAYFIQIDTLLSPDKTKPGNGETIIYQSLNGKGKTIDNGNLSFSGISYAGSGINKNKEQAHLTFYDDTIGDFIDPTHYHVDITGDPNTEIDFGDAATNIYNEIIGKKYVFNGITEGKNKSDASGNPFKDENQNLIAFQAKGIYPNFDDTDNRANNKNDIQPQYFVVHFVHGTTESQETKTISETIKYVDENTGDSIYPEYHSTNITFKRTKTHDNVTNKDTYSDWSIGSLTYVENPIIPGYTIDAGNISEKLNGEDSRLLAKSAKKIGGITFTQAEINNLPDSSIIEVVVPYVKDEVPPTPTPTPTPSNPTNPKTPSQPSVPVPNTPQTSTIKPKAPKPEKPRTVNPKTNKKQNKHISHNVPKLSQNHKNVPSFKHEHNETFKQVSTISSSISSTKETLPHTGAKQSKLGLIGLAFMSLASMLGLASSKKRKEN